MSAERVGRPTYVAAGCLAVAVFIAAIVVAATSSGRHGRTTAPTPTATTPVASTGLTFGVFGTGPELAAYRSIVATYNRTAAAPVQLRTYADAAALETAVTASTGAPDVYLLPRSGLAQVMAAHRNRPVQELLSDRGISLGDDYSRDAVTAFSADDDLQCMPYTVSPMVIYYNTDLIDLDAMRRRGMNVPPIDRSSFSLDEFRVLARYAARDGDAGLAIDPTLRGLAPFVYSGGGQVFDSATTPTSLALGRGSSVSALRSTLEILRDARLTLTSSQLDAHSAVEWFERGRVGMIAGFRGLVPQLRATRGLHFDVLPMPAIGSNRTVGDFTGVCLMAGHPDHLAAAADFLAYLVGDRAMTTLARVGSVQPADLRVAYGAAFQQPNEQPAHASVFTETLRNIVAAPLGVPFDDLETLVDPDLKALMYQPGDLGDLGQRLDAIDLASAKLLGPLASASADATP
ncbi:MAG TPA: extracellular solute-binding protein [Nocardioides sp.]|nr:extracellular solute-binding protein [Nocardioides sp.]